MVQGLLELWHKGSLVAPQHVGSQPGIKHTFPALEGGFLTTGPPGKSQNNVLLIEKLSEPYLDPDSKKSKGGGGRIELAGKNLDTDWLVHDIKELLLICLGVRMVLWLLCFFKKRILIFQRYTEIFMNKIT